MAKREGDEAWTKTLGAAKMLAGGGATALGLGLYAGITLGKIALPRGLQGAVLERLSEEVTSKIVGWGEETARDGWDDLKK